jgi:hypothetical protein
MAALPKIQHGEGGTPPQPGLYVAYVDDNVPSGFAARRILMWHEGRWWYPHSDQFYRGCVYQWIGPLPALRLED